MWFTRISIHNPVFATMLMLALSVLGVFAYQRLKIDQFPDIEFPTIVVQIEYPGAAPDIVESEVTKKVEEAVNTIAGINRLYSRSYEGQSVVIVEFNLSMDGRRAADDVREKISILRPALNDGVKEPRILRFDPASRPIYTVALLSPDNSRSQMDLTTYADQVIKKRLENVRGVGSVNLVGGLKRQINIYLRPDALEAQGLTVDQVRQVLANENQNRPAGNLRTQTQDQVVQIEARLKQPEEFKRLIVARRGEVPIRLSQVADVVDGPQEVDSLALYNGQRTLALEILKAQGENTIEVTNALTRTINELSTTLPKGMKLNVVRNSARPIEVAVNNVRRTLIEGALLTVVIVFLFLNSWRSTVITGLTLPIALIGTFFFMQVFGFSINLVTMMALSLCVGLLIDDAIVVRENIVRHLQMGKNSTQAALAGTQEIGLAVLATTLSIVAVFLPIGLMEGIIGKFFHEFGITIVAAVLISMFVSFTLDPMLSSVWHDPAVHSEGTANQARNWYDHTFGRLTGAVNRASEALSRLYETMLKWALRHKLATLGLALLSIIIALGLLRLVGSEFVPKADYSEITVNFYTPMGASIEATEAKTKQVDEILRRTPEVTYTVASINTGQALGRNFVSIYVRLTDRRLRQRSVHELSNALRTKLSTLAGITVTHVGLLDAVGGQKPISLSIQGPDMHELERLNKQILAQLAPIPGLVDLDSSLKPNRPTTAVTIKRDAAADLGLSVGSLTQSLRTLFAGETVSTWRAENDENYDVRLSLHPQARRQPSDLANLGLSRTTSGDVTPQIIRFSQVADITPGFGPNQINHRDLSREIEITGNVGGRSLGEISKDIKTIVDQMPFPPGYSVRFGGSTKDMQESFGYALSSLAMGVIFIYMILASQFKSFLQPIALMASLPLTLIGVALALLFFHSTLNLFSFIGVIMLMGLVTKNAILLIDFTNRARQGISGTGDTNLQPLSRENALLLAARVRLRPILMTSLAMIFGMVPLAFAMSEGSEQRAPMGQAVIGGVIASSILTLIVVPIAYCYLDDFAQAIGKKFHRRNAVAT